MRATARSRPEPQTKQRFEEQAQATSPTLPAEHSEAERHHIGGESREQQAEHR